MNPVDAQNRRDPSWARIAVPYVVGYEASGLVTEVGAEVSELKAGDSVWVHLPVRGTRWGTYSEEAVVGGEFVAPRPPALGAAEAAAMPLVGSTALQLLQRLDLRRGDWLLVPGAAGGVGHVLVQLAHARGARVAALASSPRHDYLASLGAEVIVDRFRKHALQEARDSVGEDFAAVADLVGHGRLEASLAFIRPGGRAASIVEIAGDLGEAIDRNITVHGVLVIASRSTLLELADVVEEGVVRPLVDEIVSFEDVSRVHDRLESERGQGKVVIAVGGSP